MRKAQAMQQVEVDVAIAETQRAQVIKRAKEWEKKEGAYYSCST
jgi:hypothetical protein